MQQIDLVIFDFDGVVVDSEHLYKKANIIALQQAYIDIPEDELNHKFWGLDYPSILKILRNEFGNARTDMFHDIIQPLANKLFQEELQAIPNVVEFIQSIPYEFCIGSNSRTAIIQQKLEMLELDGLFKGKCFGADIVNKPKPAVDLFKHCADVNQADYKNCLVIEDGIHGIIAAKKLGMTSIGFTGASHQIDEHDEKLFDAGAVAVTHDMLQIHSIIDSFSYI